MTSSVSASRLPINDPRPQPRKEGSKGQTTFQDAVHSAGAERRAGVSAAAPAMAVPAKGLARQLESIGQAGLRLSGGVIGTAATASPPAVDPAETAEAPSRADAAPAPLPRAGAAPTARSSAVEPGLPAPPPQAGRDAAARTRPTGEPASAKTDDTLKAGPEVASPSSPQVSAAKTPPLTRFEAGGGAAARTPPPGPEADGEAAVKLRPLGQPVASQTGDMAKAGPEVAIASSPRVPPTDTPPLTDSAAPPPEARGDAAVRTVPPAGSVSTSADDPLRAEPEASGPASSQDLAAPERPKPDEVRMDTRPTDRGRDASVAAVPPADSRPAPADDVGPSAPRAEDGDAWQEAETETLPADDATATEPRPRTAEAEVVAPALALLPAPQPAPRQQVRWAAEANAAPTPGATASPDDAPDVDTRSSAHTRAEVPAALSNLPPPPSDEPQAGKPGDATPPAPRTHSPAAPVTAAAAAQPAPAPATPAAPAPAQASPRNASTARTASQAGEAPATSASRNPSIVGGVRPPVEASPAPAPAFDEAPAARVPVDPETRTDEADPKPPESRSGETVRPAPNGVNLVSAPSAQAAPPSAPAASIIAAVRAEASWAAYFRDTQPAAPARIDSLKVQLNPVELGAVTAHLHIKDDTVTVELSAETADAQRQLATDADTIAKSLRALGVDVDRVTVQLSARADAQPQPEPSGQSRQQGFAADGGAGGAREQDSGSRREQHRSGGENAPAAGPPGSSSGRSSSARYI